MKKSKLYTLDPWDVVKGFVVAFFTSIITSLIKVLSNGLVPSQSEVQNIIVISLSAGLAYIAKNFLSNSNDQILKKESVEQ